MPQSPPEETSQRKASAAAGADDAGAGPTIRVRFWYWVRILLTAAGVGGAILLLERLELRSRLAPLATWIDGLGPWGPAVFVAANALIGMVPVPGLILTTTALAGVLFGAAFGTLYAFLGCSLASLGGFAMARLLGRRRAAAWLADYPRLSALDESLERDGVRIMVLIRVAIVFPFAVQSYGLGLTRASLRDYLVSLIGMLPGTVFYAVAGAAVGDIAAVVRAEDLGPQGVWRVVALVAGVAVVLVLARLLARLARQALAARTGVALLEETPDAADE